MTRTVTELQEALRKYEAQRASDEDFKRLRDFYQEMARQGLLVKKEYDLPPLDTIGATAYKKP